LTVVVRNEVTAQVVSLVRPMFLKERGLANGRTSFVDVAKTVVSFVASLVIAHNAGGSLLGRLFATEAVGAVLLGIKS
jgi:hypothetical protein